MAADEERAAALPVVASATGSFQRLLALCPDHRTPTEHGRGRLPNYTLVTVRYVASGEFADLDPMPATDETEYLKRAGGLVYMPPRLQTYPLLARTRCVDGATVIL